jgi:hypothetical protein
VRESARDFQRHGQADYATADHNGVVTGITHER